MLLMMFLEIIQFLIEFRIFFSHFYFCTWNLLVMINLLLWRYSFKYSFNTLYSVLLRVCFITKLSLKNLFGFLESCQFCTCFFHLILFLKLDTTEWKRTLHRFIKKNSNKIICTMKLISIYALSHIYYFLLFVIIEHWIMDFPFICFFFCSFVWLTLL